MNNRIKTLAVWTIIAVILIFVVPAIVGNTSREMTYSELIEKINSGEVTDIEISYGGGDAEVKLKDETNTRDVNIPDVENLLDNLNSSMKSDSINVTYQDEPFLGVVSDMLLPISSILLIIMMLMLFAGGRGTQNGSNPMSFGKSKARMISPNSKNKVTFDDVAGIDEEKEELQEVVEFLKNPKKYTDMGARIPKGVLLVGQPGTGKTLLARAVAGEAGVPFFFISGSDFVEMFVGVGASRVRDLFEEAKKNAPSIIFIDEIDAVGRQRGAGLGGGHDEREQILEVHSKQKKFADDVDLKLIAKNTSGFTGADLENLLNEAALLAARRDETEINEKDIEDAMVKVTMGPEKKSRVRNEKEKRLVAYHEAGHAVVSKFLPTQDDVHEISIIPRGMAGGYTMYQPSEDKSFISKTEMLENIVSLLGGRVSEELNIGDISTGASNDIERATKIAKAMCTKYGMSDRIGTITLGSDQDEVFLGRDFAQEKSYSEETAGVIDEEVKKIIDWAYGRAKEILSQNKDKVDKVVAVLIEKEKITGDEFNAIFNEQ